MDRYYITTQSVLRFSFSLFTFKIYAMSTITKGHFLMQLINISTRALMYFLFSYLRERFKKC